MRIRPALTALLVVPLLALTPAVPGPPVFSENVELLAQIPDAAAISAAFDQQRPYLYVSTLHGIDVYDVSDPALPVLVGAAPMALFQNEAVSMGQAVAREDGTTFVLVGLDAAGAAVQKGSPSVRRSSTALYVVDVTDPARPFVRSSTPSTTNTHTVSCADAACNYAYTAGTRTKFSIIDLRDLDAPAELKTVPSPFGWHDWDLDDTGTIAWQTGDGGSAAWDVTDPANPVLLNTTNANGKAGGPGGWNDFIHHNLVRPNGNLFDDRQVDADGNVVGYHSGEPSLSNGNVALITEEDYLDPACGAGEGSFQTWHVDVLSREGVARANPGEGEGSFTPLDKWNTELLGTGQDNLFGAFCSAHYFDFHQDGFVAQGWYQQGLRILDVRDPRDIKQVGYWVLEASEVWSAYWVPERNADGTVQVSDETGAVMRSDIVYTTDAVRGIDVLRVTMPTSAPEDTTPVTAPILDTWLGTAAEVQGRESEFGFACLLTPRASTD